ELEDRGRGREGHARGAAGAGVSRAAGARRVEDDHVRGRLLVVKGALLAVAACGSVARGPAAPISSDGGRADRDVSIVLYRDGAALGPARVTLIDDTVGDGAAAVAQAIARSEADQTASTTLPAPVDVGVGELAIDLVGGARAIESHALLVYDPVGAELDK